MASCCEQLVAEPQVSDLGGDPESHALLESAPLAPGNVVRLGNGSFPPPPSPSSLGFGAGFRSGLQLAGAKNADIFACP